MNLTKKQISKFWDRVEKTSTCWNWTGHTQNGYGRVSFSFKVYKAHRISLFLNGISFNPLKKEKGSKGDIVMHSCDNRTCVNPSHLILTNQRENMLDAKKKGRKYFGETRGEGNPRSKLTWKDVNLIRSSNMSLSKFQQMFPFVNKGNLMSIKSFKTWKIFNHQ